MKRFYFGNLLAFLFIFGLAATSCSSQTEVQSLDSLRQLTRDGKLPAESVVEQLERRYAGRQTGVLARLLRARIKFENKDFAGAATLLDSPDFGTKTKLGDYALWLRGQALQGTAKHLDAIAAFERLLADYPDSIRATDAKLRLADSAMQTGRQGTVKDILLPLTEAGNPAALLQVAEAYEAQGNQDQALLFYLRTYFLGYGSDASKEAENKLVALGNKPLLPATLTSDETIIWGNRLLASKKFPEAVIAFQNVRSNAHGPEPTLKWQLGMVQALIGANRIAEAQRSLNSFSNSASDEKEAAYREVVIGYAKVKQWPQARQAAEEMRQKFPAGKLTPKAWVDAGYAARDAKNKAEESFFLQGALITWPTAVEVAGAQFELAWLEHESKNYARASEMMIEHLARYADKDTTNRGKAGYWAARNAELAGKIVDACALYDGVNYRYGANWYGYIGLQRVGTLRNRGECKSPSNLSSSVTKAVSNLKTVTVAAETAGSNELERAEKSEQLSTIGLFDWAIDELNEAKKTAANSPKINLALAKHYRLKGDNVNALLALAKSYPDYAQMFPEEMGRDEWEIFYPHVAWDQIAAWAKHRNLDMYQVAGLIRQESVFNPRARSGAQAFGLMQLLLPTARLVARKYGSTANLASADALYQPALNIELGTGYMRDQLDKFGRIEYMAVAYNAGPGRVAPWRATLPMEMDEFVEAIPFKETKGYVQGVIRNSAQYRRLYDQNGNFKPNVGTRPLRGEIDSKPREQFTAEFPEVSVDTSNGVNN